MQGQTLSGGIENYGWKDVNGKIQILWENEDFVNMHCTSKGCGCKGGCDGSKAGCKNCYRMCKPCTPKCKCKINCKNPHNNGGKCDKCKVANTEMTTTNSEPPNTPTITINSELPNTDHDDNDESNNIDEDRDSNHDDGDSDYEENNDISEEDDAMLPTQLATSNDRVDTDSENDSDSEHEED